MVKFLKARRCGASPRPPCAAPGPPLCRCSPASFSPAWRGLPALQPLGPRGGRRRPVMPAWDPALPAPAS
jgi:hypothetical protein